MSDEFLPAQAAEPVAVKALQEAIQFLGWVATSYDTHGDTAEKSGGHPEEVEAYRGSAGMARDHAKALAALSGAAPQAGEDAKPEQWGDETVIADWWLIQNKHGQIVRGERTKDAAVNLDGGLWEGDIIIPVKRAVAAPPAEGWRPTQAAIAANFWAFLQGEHGVRLSAEDREDHNVAKFLALIEER